MSWYADNQITASKLNSENHVAHYAQVRTIVGDSGDELSGSHLFYYHDGGGTANPVVMDWNVQSTDEKYWGNWYAPAAKLWVEKRTAGGTRIGSRYNICDIQNDDANIVGNLTKNELASLFGSAEGWYYFYWWVQGDVHGSASIAFYAYGFPTNNKVNRPLRYYHYPSSSDHAAPNTKELTAALLNTHRVGTY